MTRGDLSRWSDADGIFFRQVDAMVTSVKPTGIFTLAGPLVVFIARKVCVCIILIL